MRRHLPCEHPSLRPTPRFQRGRVEKPPSGESPRMGPASRRGSATWLGGSGPRGHRRGPRGPGSLEATLWAPAMGPVRRPERSSAHRSSRVGISSLWTPAWPSHPVARWRGRLAETARTWTSLSRVPASTWAFLSIHSADEINFSTVRWQHATIPVPTQHRAMTLQQIAAFVALTGFAGLVGVFGLGIIGNLAASSRPERRMGVPLSTLFTAACLVVAVSL